MCFYQEVIEILMNRLNLPKRKNKRIFIFSKKVKIFLRIYRVYYTYIERLFFVIDRYIYALHSYRKNQRTKKKKEINIWDWGKRVINA